MIPLFSNEFLRFGFRSSSSGLCSIGISYDKYIGIVAIVNGNIAHLSFYNENHIEKAIQKIVSLTKQHNIDQSNICIGRSNIELEINKLLLSRYYNIQSIDLLEKQKGLYANVLTTLSFQLKDAFISNEIGSIQDTTDSFKLITQLQSICFKTKGKQYIIENKKPMFFVTALALAYSAKQNNSTSPILIGL